MNLTTTFKDEHLEFALWVEITTKQPCCTYYFGPFLSPQEAQWFLPGYVEDLEEEGYEEIRIQFKQCQPKELTIFEEGSDCFSAYDPQAVAKQKCLIHLEQDLKALTK
jgi:hypothetical protein